MAFKKAQANFDNGTTYDVLHYETQVGQVKILDSNGTISSNLDEMIISGKSIENQDLHAVKASGKYKVKGGTDLPVGLVPTNTYILKVDSVTVGATTIVHQELYDHINHEVYHRTINGASSGGWFKLGKSVVDQVAKIGNLSNLYTTNKASVVDAINSLSAELQVVADIDNAQLQSNIDAVNTKLNSHNHDTRYLSLSGGSLTNTLSIANDKSMAGKNTSGSNLNLGKVNGTNDVVLGDVGAKTIVQAKSGDLSLSDGTSSHKIFHSGNDGAGSGLDADTLDGVEGSLFARRDVSNYFKTDQFIDEGKSLVIRASAGSSQAGSLFFRDGSNVQKGKVSVNTDGDMSFFAGAINGHTMRSNGELFSNYKHILDASSRENGFVFKRGTGDAGIGIAMSTNGAFNVNDLENGKKVFGLNRSDNVVEFTNSIRLAGTKLTIQEASPANPKIGDVWIGI